MLAEHRLSLVRRRTNWDVILRKLDVDGEFQPDTDADVDDGVVDKSIFLNLISYKAVTIRLRQDQE